MDLDKFTKFGYVIYIGNVMKASSGIDYLLVTSEVALTDEEDAILKAAAEILDKRIENVCVVV